MAYFAKIENGLVTQVISVSNNDAPDPAPENSELLGQAFIASIGLEGEWKQTSFNGTFRFNYAGINYTYDETRDAFIPPQPYASWVLDEDTCLWVAPIPMPDGDYVWDEDAGDWVVTPDQE
jgi:hypothetical protein